MSKINYVAIVFILLIIFLLTVFIVETLFLFKTYNDADIVECNFLYCKMTTIKKLTNISHECFKNEIKINCDDILIPEND